MSIQKEPVSLGTKLITLGVGVVLLGGIGFFSYGKVYEAMEKGSEATVVQEVVTSDIPDIAPPNSNNVEPANTVQEQPSVPAVNEPVIPTFAYTQQLTEVFPGATINPAPATSQLFETIQLPAPADVYLLKMATGESVFIYHIKKQTTVDMPFTTLQQSVVNQPDPKVGISATTMSQKPAFYYNHLDKGQNVRIVIEHKNGEVYAFDYPKGYHQAFKTFFQML